MTILDDQSGRFLNSFRERFILALILIVACTFNSLAQEPKLKRLKYNNAGLLVDLAVGLRGWPLPMDFTGDGTTDLVVICSDTPYDGVYLFERAGYMDTETGLPVFTAGKRLGEARKFLRPNERLDRAANVRISYVNNESVILTPNKRYPDFINTLFEKPETLNMDPVFHGFDRYFVRADQWEYVDFDFNGIYDLIVGIGYWEDYKKGNYNDLGQWTGGPLHGYTYFFQNNGTNANPKYANPERLKTIDGNDVDVYGWPSPSFADFTNNGHIDLICGEFRDGFTYFENISTNERPLFTPGRPLTFNDTLLKVSLTMPVPVAYDFDKNGTTDLIIGEEAGRIAWMENTGQLVDGIPRFLPPIFFKQEADEINVGALATPVGFDWNGDGMEDLLSGNSEGQIVYIEKLENSPSKWSKPELLKAGDDVIRIKAGYNGSIQGPSEQKWGYTTISVADWNHDGLPDIIANSIWGKIIWYENIGSRTQPKLAVSKPIEVEWKGLISKPSWNWWDPVGKELVTQWRTTPIALDWTGNGLTDLIVLDHEGYLALFCREIRNNRVVLLPGKRVFKLEGETGPLRLNEDDKGGSGRRKISIVDLDHDGKMDLLVNDINARFYKNIGEKEGLILFKDLGDIDVLKLAGHNSSPATIDLDADGIREVIIGAEDGFIYSMPNPFFKSLNSE